MVRIVALASALSICACSLPASAQQYPVKPLRLIVPFPPGGTSDVLARLIQPKLSESLGQPLIIDNRGGAGGSIGAAAAARASADGYTLMIVADPHAVMNHLYQEAPDIFTAFEHIVMMTTSPSLLVGSVSFTPSNVKELVAAARAKPRAVTYATPGSGTFNHLSGLLLEQAAGIEMTHVPYKGGGPMVQALLGNHVNVMFISAPLVMDQVKAGKLRALAVGSRQRIAQLPDVASISETYPSIQLFAWSGIVAPAGLPREAAARINRDVLRTLADGDVRRRLGESGFDIAGSTPEEFLRFVRAEHDKLGRVIRENGIKVE